ncbi:MAG TPA: hypothetical protein VM123_01860 [archaeon]|nr:hypothetical protein [archaeon]
MNTKKISVEITDQITPEVICGLELYARLTNQSSLRDTVDDWLYWFKDNPFGTGLFAYAKSGGQVVGFYSAIPTEMLLSGELQVGAKGEFFAVDPLFKKTVDISSGLDLPYALAYRLNRAAIEYGFKTTFATARKGAEILLVFTGAKTLKYCKRLFVTYFKPPEIMSRRNPVLKTLYSHYLKVYTSLRRFYFMFRLTEKAETSNFRLQEEYSQDDLIPDRDKNVLFLPSVRMLNFRFPANKYLKYSIEGNNNQPCYLVFTKPDINRVVELKYWSSGYIPPETLARVIHDVIKRCRKAHAASLGFPVNLDDEDKQSLLKKMGFLETKRTNRAFVFSADKRVMQKCKDPQQWLLTDAHTGYYQI